MDKESRRRVCGEFPIPRDPLISRRPSFRRETGDPQLDKDGQEAASGSRKHLTTPATLTGRPQVATAAAEYDLAVIQWSRIRGRSSGFPARRWILDPGPAFEEEAVTARVRREGHFPDDLLLDYARAALGFSGCGQLVAVRAPDFPWTARERDAQRNFSPGISVSDYQRVGTRAFLRLTYLLENFGFVGSSLGLEGPLSGDIKKPPYVMPTLTGDTGPDYVDHLRDIERKFCGGILGGAWVAVGHRDRSGKTPLYGMESLLLHRPDLRLHLPGAPEKILRMESAWFRTYTLDIGYSWSHNARSSGKQNDQRQLGVALAEKSSQPRDGMLNIFDYSLTCE